MEEIKKSVVDSLDGTEIELFQYLPYILQDLWEIGADPATMLSLLKKNIENKNLKVLDLGCGKGAVSIHLARQLRCKVVGIDAMPEFINSAKQYAEKYKVNHLCGFEVGDIRGKVKDLNGFDVVILGAIGPVLGTLYETLRALAGVLSEQGYVILDDAYMDEKSRTKYNRCLRKKDFYNQIAMAGFEIIEEIIFAKDAINETDNSIYECIEKRVSELINQHPRKKDMLDGYLRSQEFENYMLANELVTGTWLLRLKSSDTI